jgi:hypothetical protein
LTATILTPLVAVQRERSAERTFTVLAKAKPPSAYVCDIGNRLGRTDAQGWLLADQASQRPPVFAGIRIVKIEQVVI